MLKLKQQTRTTDNEGQTRLSICTLLDGTKLNTFYFLFSFFWIVECRLFAPRLSFPWLFSLFGALWRFSVVSSQNPAFDSLSFPENKTPLSACRMRRAGGLQPGAAAMLSVFVAPKRVRQAGVRTLTAQLHGLWRAPGVCLHPNTKCHIKAPARPPVWECCWGADATVTPASETQRQVVRGMSRHQGCTRLEVKSGGWDSP